MIIFTNKADMAIQITLNGVHNSEGSDLHPVPSLLTCSPYESARRPTFLDSNRGFPAWNDFSGSRQIPDFHVSARAPRLLTSDEQNQQDSEEAWSREDVGKDSDAAQICKALTLLAGETKSILMPSNTSALMCSAAFQERNRYTIV